MTKESINAIQVVVCKCGSIVAACTQPECFADKDWQTDMAVQQAKGRSIEWREPGTWTLESCKCTPAPRPVVAAKWIGFEERDPAIGQLVIIEFPPEQKSTPFLGCWTPMIEVFDGSRWMPFSNLTDFASRKVVTDDADMKHHAIGFAEWIRINRWEMGVSDWFKWVIDEDEQTRMINKTTEELYEMYEQYLKAK